MSRLPVLVIAAAIVLPAVNASAPVSSDENARREGTELSSQARQRPRVRVTPPAAYDYPRPGPYAWPGPGMVRRCVDWYATEYRPSGTVVTPQMRCRWVRG
ncbi:MAG: hypothetical protein AB7V13_08025 [Pseudorhodoplanes sp.]|uniref:hypothetical protein n=1 Tax=Pseudorhodoplanes sp. TaxID=1934341 RepID=UPI003D0AD382